MYHGNKQLITQHISECIYEVIKEVISDGREVCWEAKGWEKYLPKFREISIKAAEQITQKVNDIGDKPYIKGKFSKEDIRRGEEPVYLFFDELYNINNRLAKRYSKNFSKYLEKKIKALITLWKEQKDVSDSRKRRGKGKRYSGREHIENDSK